MAEDEEVQNEEEIVREILEEESETLHAVVNDMMTALNENGFKSCQLKIGDIGIIASKRVKNSVSMRVGTFSIEITDSETTTKKKIEKIAWLLKKIKEMSIDVETAVFPYGGASEGMFE